MSCRCVLLASSGSGSRMLPALLRRLRSTHNFGACALAMVRAATVKPAAVFECVVVAQAGGGMREGARDARELGRAAGAGRQVLPARRGPVAHVGQGALGRRRR